jgi:hypothetical protein
VEFLAYWQIDGGDSLKSRLEIINEKNCSCYLCFGVKLERLCSSCLVLQSVAVTFNPLGVELSSDFAAVAWSCS